VAVGAQAGVTAQRMYGKAVVLALLLGSCSPVPQSASLRTVAAYEVPLPTAADKARFLELMRIHAVGEGFHLDAATPAELEAQSSVSPITFNASVWRGDDDEVIASAMDFQDHIGRVWITFAKGEDPVRSARFRDRLMPMVQRTWPGTAALPIMPNSSIPLVNDMIRTSSGYRVIPSAASKYALEPKDEG